MSSFPQHVQNIKALEEKAIDDLVDLIDSLIYEIKEREKIKDE